MIIFGIKIKKFWSFFIIYLVIGTGIASLIGLLINTGIFREKAIGQKYCYYFKNDTIDEVYAADNIEKTYQIIAYYYCKIKRKGSIRWDNMYSMGKEITKVEILKYTEDSLIAKVRYKYFSDMRGGMIIEEKSYVPYFTLHDTLPIGIKASNEEQMQK